MTQVKTAMLGGTFDPIHLGHLFLLDAAVRNTDYKRFLIVPANVNNFKQDSRPSATDCQRLEMAELAVIDFKEIYGCPDDVEIIVSDAEIKRGGVSYTYDTVCQIKSEFNISDRLGLIMGDDLIHKLSDWYRFRDLSQIVEYLICRRETEPCWEELPSGICFRKIQTGNTSPETSTAIRNGIADNSSCLSARVLAYIKENGLYDYR